MVTNKETMDRLIAEGKVQYPIWVFDCIDIQRAQEAWRKTLQGQGAMWNALWKELFTEIWESLPTISKILFQIVVWVDDKLKVIRRRLGI